MSREARPRCQPSSQLVRARSSKESAGASAARHERTRAMPLTAHTGSVATRRRLGRPVAVTRRARVLRTDQPRSSAGPIPRERTPINEDGTSSRRNQWARLWFAIVDPGSRPHTRGRAEAPQRAEGSTAWSPAVSQALAISAAVATDGASESLGLRMPHPVQKFAEAVVGLPA
jgi:hypothetical protein